MTTLFRTPVPIPELSDKITHHDKILMLGSCFSENIGARLSAFHFNVLCNPTGILYNPFSISSSLYRIIRGTPYQKSDLFEYQGRWHSFDHHSRYSKTSPEQTLELINSNLLEAHHQIETTSICILTPGTSFIFTESSTKKVVANCHRLPQQQFIRRCASSQEIYAEWKELFSHISQLFPSIRFILTISPVRHYPSQPRDNQLSKSNLVSALYELENEFSNIYYFPSFEIMMDELRDYRFYNEDMTHPNDTAVNYIWERFLESCISDRAREFVKKFAPIYQAKQHRLFSDSTRDLLTQFVCSNIEKINHLKDAFPEIDFKDDIIFFSKMGNHESFGLS
jgi:hypothetical protein